MLPLSIVRPRGLTGFESANDLQLPGRGGSIFKQPKDLVAETVHRCVQPSKPPKYVGLAFLFC